MKVPFSWLKEFVDIDVTAQELEEKLFSCGFEVEELIPLDAGISKVVVGKIVEMEKQEVGDNRNHSQDSRFWRNQYVEKDEILGKVVLRYYKGFKWIS